MLRGRHSTGRTLSQSLTLAITGAGAAVFRALAEADWNIAVSPASLEIALEACVDESAHHALVNAGGREIV
jgi:hypothetical protein